MPPFAALLIVGFFASLAFATLVLGWSEAGWPSNHEGYWFAQRIHVYARHYAALDPLPLWTSIDASGFGSPMPVVYHKLFYMIAGTLTLATHSIKTAVILTLTLFLTLGALGLHQTMRAIGGSRLASIIAGCCLMTANYTVTNWLVRGAMAETTAAMLVPWLLYFFVRSIQTGRLRPALGVVLGFVWLGHSVLAFYAVLTLGTVYVLLATMRLASWSAIDPRTAWPAVVLFACFLLPYLVPMAILGRGYDFARIITPPWNPSNQMRPLLSYLWDRDWSAAGSKSVGVTVQLDSAILVLFVGATGALALRSYSRVHERRPVFERLRTLAPFLLLAAIAFVLQTSIAEPFYEVVPGAAFIQFPWRLLALITPALIVAAVYLADYALPDQARTFCLGAAVAWMTVSSLAFTMQDSSRVELDPVPVDNVRFSFGSLREYEPTEASPVKALQSTIDALWARAGCSYVIESGPREVVIKRFRTTCDRSTMLPLPVFASRIHQVDAPGYPSRQRCLPVQGFAATCGAIIPAGTNVVSVRFPTELSLAAWGLERVTARLGEMRSLGWWALQDSNLRPPGS